MMQCSVTAWVWQETTGGTEVRLWGFCIAVKW